MNTWDESDLKIDLYRAGQCTVRVTHLPSGRTATSDPQDSESAAKQQAIERLRSKGQGGPRVPGVERTLKR